MVNHRVRAGFLAMILVQVVHSLEEVVFRLYEVFAPARWASQLLSDNPAVGFALLNVALCTFGIWCYWARVRPGHASAERWIWPWIAVELGNGITHPTVALLRGEYFTGVATAPLLLGIASYLAIQLVRERRAAA